MVEAGENKQGVRATPAPATLPDPQPGLLPPPTRPGSSRWGPQDVNPRRPAPFRAGRGLRAAATGAREVARTGPGRGCREVAGPPAPPPPSLTHGGPGSDLPRARRPGRSAPGPPPSRLAQLSARRAGVPASSPAPASPARASQVSAAARGEGGAGHAGQGRAWRGRKAGRGPLPFHSTPPAGRSAPAADKAPEVRAPRALPAPAASASARTRRARVLAGSPGPESSNRFECQPGFTGSSPSPPPTPLPRVRASRASPCVSASRPAPLCAPVAAGAGRGLQGPVLRGRP